MNYLGILLFVLFVFDEVYAEFCGGGDDLWCRDPSFCCNGENRCCTEQPVPRYSHNNFRMRIWNMWYFWFLIIFMMMSCFGGCGYYRRRRLALMTPSRSPPLRPAGRTILSPHHNRGMGPQPVVDASPYNYFVFSGAGPMQPQVTNMPPAYAEVMRQPGLFPPNKVELPPYPGPDKPADAPSMSTVNEVSPPPYAEFQHEDPQFDPPRQTVARETTSIDTNERTNTNIVP